MADWIDNKKFRKWARNYAQYVALFGPVSAANQMRVYGFAWWKVGTIAAGLAGIIAAGIAIIWFFLHFQAWWNLRRAH